MLYIIFKTNNQTAIHKSLRSFDLNLSKLVGFGSDGASAMLGEKNGAATKMKLLSPSLVSFHCPAHHLQLAIGDGIKNVINIMINCN